MSASLAARRAAGSGIKSCRGLEIKLITHPLLLMLRANALPKGTNG